jgi:integrase
MAVFKRYQGKRITAKDPNYRKARWWVHKCIRGRIIHQSIPEAQNKADAEAFEAKLLSDLLKRRLGTAKEVSFAEFVDNQYEKYVRQKNVNIGAKLLYIRELKYFFGKMLLADITAQDCRDYQFKRKNSKTHDGRPRAAASVNRETSTLSKIFTLACQEGLLERNPMQYVVGLTEPPPRRSLLDSKQKENLWTELVKDSLLYDLVTLAVNLPLRKGQILAITRDAIDLDRRVLLAIESKGREPRVVPINDAAAAVFRRRMEDPSSLLFHNDGEPIKDFRRRWHGALVRAKINKKDGKRGDNFTFHDLRKWFASELIRRNVNPSIVQKLFAHSDMAITNVYMHSHDAELFAAVRQLDDDPVQSSEVVQ